MASCRVVFAILVCLLTPERIGGDDVTSTSSGSVESSEFLRDNVAPGKPLKIVECLKGLDWPDENKISLLPETFTTFVKIHKNCNQLSRGAEERKDGDGTVSLRHLMLLSSEKNEEVCVEKLVLPSSYRSLMKVPRTLACLQPKNISVFADISSGETTVEDRIVDKDAMICQWIGNGTDVHLAKLLSEADGYGDRQQSILDHTGDCLFVPKGSKVKYATRAMTTWMVFIMWEHLDEPNPSDSCDSSSAELTLEEIVNDDVSGTDWDLVLLQYFIAVYVVKDDQNKSSFLDKIKEDRILKHIREWDEHALTTAEKLFVLLDVNKDGKLSKDDYSYLSSQTVQSLAKSVTETFNDFKATESDDLTVTGNQESDDKAENPAQEKETDATVSVSDDDNEKTDEGKPNLLNKDVMQEIQSEINKELNGGFGKVLEDVFQSEEFLTEMNKELQSMKDLGVNVGDMNKVVKELRNAMKVGAAQPTAENDENRRDDDSAKETDPEHDPTKKTEL